MGFWHIELFCASINNSERDKRALGTLQQKTIACSTPHGTNGFEENAGIWGKVVIISIFDNLKVHYIMQGTYVRRDSILRFEIIFDLFCVSRQRFTTVRSSCTTLHKSVTVLHVRFWIIYLDLTRGGWSCAAGWTISSGCVASVHF